MKQENSLYSNALENLPNGDGFADPTIPHSNDRALIGLDSLFFSFLNFYADLYGVTDVNYGEIGLQMLRFNGVDNGLGVHLILLKLTIANST